MMAKIRVRDKDYAQPDVARLAHFSLHETLILLGPMKDNAQKVFCFGIGMVGRIEKGEEFDIVKMNFGRAFRDVIVKHNHARRQIYTLKKGQFAWFYGIMTHYKVGNQNKSSLFALALQGWYVPKSMDIIKINPEDIEKLTEENKSKVDFIDKILEGEEI